MSAAVRSPVHVTLPELLTVTAGASEPALGAVLMVKATAEVLSISARAFVCVSSKKLSSRGGAAAVKLNGGAGSGGHT